MTRNYPDMGSDSDWSCRVENLLPGSDSSSVWNFFVRFLVSRGNQWWCCGMSAVYSGYKKNVKKKSSLVLLFNNFHNQGKE